MKRPSQLTQLIWNFYRENPRELKLLKTLASCKVCRRWGSLQIHCVDVDTAHFIASHHSLLEVPIAQLRLAQKIKIFVNKTLVTVFEVNPSAMIPWEL